MADFLLANGVDINSKVTGGVTALHSAHKLRMDSLEYLMEKGADVTAVDSTGNTVLHAAAWSQRDEIVMKLIESGVDVNAKNNEGNTALMNACRRDSIDVIKVFLDNGASLEVGECKDENGCEKKWQVQISICQPHNAPKTTGCTRPFRHNSTDQRKWASNFQRCEQVGH